MNLRRKPKRADMVQDAVAVALGAARQSLKNHLIVRALRDHVDFDRETYLATAAVELGLLAAENETDAARVSQQVDDARGRLGMARHPTDFRVGDRRQLRRRRRVLTEVAERLRELATEPDEVAQLLDGARDLALAEIQAVTAAAHAPRRRGIRPEERAAALSELRSELDDLLFENTGY